MDGNYEYDEFDLAGMELSEEQKHSIRIACVGYGISISSMIQFLQIDTAPKMNNTRQELMDRLNDCSRELQETKFLPLVDIKDKKWNKNYFWE